MEDKAKKKLKPFFIFKELVFQIMIGTIKPLNHPNRYTNTFSVV